MVTLLNERGSAQEWCGLSTDTKPTEGVSNGATFVELDGMSVFVFNEEAKGWLSADETAFLRTLTVDLSGIGTQYEGIEPDFTGIAATATYSDGTTDDVSASVTAVNAPEVWGGGDTDIVFAYNDGEMRVTAAETVTVVAQELDSIAVDTAPTKVVYAAGAYFDPTGLIVTATYNNALTEDIAYPDDRLAFSPNLETALTAENESVTITCTIGGVNKTATQAITVS